MLPRLHSKGRVIPVNPPPPGVYVQEIASAVRSVAAVPTSIAAFVGRTRRGPVNAPTACFNIGQFHRHFGGLWASGPLSYAVEDFFINGGGHAEIVRLYKAKTGTNGIATINIGTLQLCARDPGSWGNDLKVTVTHPAVTDPAGAATSAAQLGLELDDLFDLRIEDNGTGDVEVHQYLTTRADGGARRFDHALSATSQLVGPAPDINGSVQLGARPAHNANAVGTGGDDGEPLNAATFIGDEDAETGIYALRKADIFNLLCIPPDERGGTLDRSVNERAAAFCKARRAMLIIDPPAEWDANPATAVATARAAQLDMTNSVLPITNADVAALYFPRLMKPDPLRGGQLDAFPPCGAVAGAFARTDATRGVWKAPAGATAALSGVAGFTVKLTDEDTGLLNSVAINCLRSFPRLGPVIWGARTLKGADQLSHEHKYVPVRRLALFIEESLYRGTKWVVFESNDQPLWAQIRLSVGAFMQQLFLQGAFQGQTPRDAYFVKCDADTTTQHDRDRGIVNILVGFAPLKPAEFSIISIQQTTNEA